MAKKSTFLFLFIAIITMQFNVHGMEKWEQIKKDVTKSHYWDTTKYTAAGALSLGIPLITLKNIFENNYSDKTKFKSCNKCNNFNSSKKSCHKCKNKTIPSIKNTISYLLGKNTDINTIKGKIITPSLAVGIISPIFIILDLIGIIEKGCKFAFMLNVGNFAHTTYQIQKHKK